MRNKPYYITQSKFNFNIDYCSEFIFQWIRLTHVKLKIIFPSISVIPYKITRKTTPLRPPFRKQRRENMELPRLKLNERCSKFFHLSTSDDRSSCKFELELLPKDWLSTTIVISHNFLEISHFDLFL